MRILTPKDLSRTDVLWSPNQALMLTAEAEVVSRCAQENQLVVAVRRQCETAVWEVRW